MDDHQTERAPARARVRFGTKPHQTIPHEYAERIIMTLAADSPAQFGSRLRAVVMADLGGDSKPDGQQP